jgi:hypothetical protein
MRKLIVSMAQMQHIIVLRDDAFALKGVAAPNLLT